MGRERLGGGDKMTVGESEKVNEMEDKRRCGKEGRDEKYCENTGREGRRYTERIW